MKAQYPIEYHEKRGWSLGVSALPFVAFLFGIAGGAAGMAYSTATNFKRAFLKHGKPVPEERLPPMIIGAIVLPVSMLWFAWSSMTYVSWVPSVIATAFIGGSLLVTFWQGINYLIVRGPSPRASCRRHANSLPRTSTGRCRIAPSP